MSGFRSLTIFQPGIIGTFTFGASAVRLTAAMRDVPEAYPAAVALGDPFDRKRRAEALRLLEVLTPRQQAKILAAYDRRRDATEAA